jgi:hypothetical protein
MGGLGPEERALGGMLAVVAGEAWCSVAVDDPTLTGARRPAAARLLALARGYAEGADMSAFRRHATRYASVETPAWVLAVALARPNRRAVVADTLELALALGMLSREALGACVSYAELAWAAATDTALPPAPDPEVETEALVAEPDHPFLLATRVGRRALEEGADLVAAVEALPFGTLPALRAAVAGLVGLRQGASALPDVWRRVLGEVDRQGEDDALACFALAPALVARRGHLGPLPSRRPGIGTVGPDSPRR